MISMISPIRKKYDQREHQDQHFQHPDGIWRGSHKWGRGTENISFEKGQVKLSKLVKILAVKNKMLKHIPSPSEESEYYGIPLQQVNICKVTFGVQCLNSYIFPGHYFSVCPAFAEQPYFTILNRSENIDLKISQI